jgi:hypothetical protein
VWAVKNAFLGNTFFDASASAFLIGEAGQRIVLPSTISNAASPTAATDAAGTFPAVQWGWKSMDASSLPPCLSAERATTPGRTSLVVTSDTACGAEPTASFRTVEIDHTSSGALDSCASTVEGALPPRVGGRRWRKRPRSDPQLGSNPSASAAKLIDAAPRSGLSETIYGGSVGPAWIALLRAASGSEQAIAEPPLPVSPVFLEAEVEVIALRHPGDAQWSLTEPARGIDATVHRAALPHEWLLFSSGPGGGDDKVDWPLQVLLSNGHVYGCDFIVSATGTDPAAHLAWVPPSLLRSTTDGGLLVDHRMRAIGQPNIFVAGDAASVEWPRAAVNATPGGLLPLENPLAQRPLWFQMRLWNAARTTGRFAAKSMAEALDPLEEDGTGGLAFELFAHVTRFLGFKVVLLGLFNGQGLGALYETAMQRIVITSAGVQAAKPGTEQERRVSAAAGVVVPALKECCDFSSRTSIAAPAVEVHVRVSPGLEYVKLVVLHGRVVGAMLIGETDLEEAVENLILNRTDVTGMDLLHPDTDLEDFFD